MRFSIRAGLLPLAALCLAVFCAAGFTFKAAPCFAATPQQQADAQNITAPESAAQPVTQTIPADAFFASMLVNAENGQARAMLTVGVLYEQGVGVPRHFTKAFEWYRKAADAGENEAWMRLGACYEIGVGTTADPAKALEAFTRSAAMGFVPAQFKLAGMYLHGRGVGKDEAKGFTYLTQAAEGGELAAMFDLGQVWRSGLFGQTADPVKARTWFAKGAEGGHAASILALASMLKDGTGGKADPEGALRWYLIGQKGGMSGEPLDAVIKELRGKLSAAKAKEAEKAADAWIAARAKAQTGQTQQ